MWVNVKLFVAGFDKIPRAVATCRKAFHGSSSQAGLKNRNVIFTSSFSASCKGNITRQSRQWDKRTAGVRAAKEAKPAWIEMTAIFGDAQYDEALEMAAWCRKCIYLKPKLEKLAAEYHPNIKFYFVDVNTVASSLVSRAEVTLWKNKEKVGPVIGGDQGWLPK